MNDTLIENIKLKSDLEYDLLFESKEYHGLDSNTKTFIKECYDMGVNRSIYLHQQDQALLESIDEGLWDRVKAGAARVGQGLKNVTGIGQQTTDSKDAGVNSLLNSFKQKFEKAKQASAQPNGNQTVATELTNDLEKIDNASKSDNTPPPTPQQAAAVVQQSTAPKGLKDKILNAIKQNPGKTKFLLGALAFGAGVAAAAATGGNPLVGKAAGALINGIGNAALAKIQGRGTGDAVMSGVGGALAGASLASLGAGATNLLGVAAEKGVDAVMGTDGSALPVTKTAGSFVPTDAGEDAALQASQNYTPMEPGDPGYTDPSYVAPEDLKTSDGYDADADTNQYDAQGNRIPSDPESLSTQGGYDADADTNQYDAQGNRIQSSPEDLKTSGGYDADADTNQYDAQGNRIDQTQQPVANSGAKVNQPQPKWTTTSRATNWGMGAQKGAQALQNLRRESVEPMFVKSYNNTYTFKKSLNENIEEKWEENIEETLDEALSPEQQKIYDEFLVDLGKMFKQPKDQVISFMQSQGTRFKNVLDYINQNVTTAAPATPAAPPAQPGGIPQITPQLRLDVDTKIKTLLSGLTILNPKVQKLLKKNPATRVAGKNASYVFRLTNTGDIAFIIKGWIGQTPFLYQDKPTIAQQNAQQVLIKEIAYKPIDTLKNNFIVQLSKNLALYYSKLPQLAGQLKQDQLETVIKNYLNQAAKTNPGFNKLFGSIMTLLDSVSTRMKASKNKPKQIWIGITSKGMGLFTGLPSKKKVQAGKPQAGKVQAGKSSVRKNP